LPFSIRKGSRDAFERARGHSKGAPRERGGAMREQQRSRSDKGAAGKQVGAVRE